MEPKDRIIVALDVKLPDEAKALVDQLTPYVGGFKVGLEFTTSTYASLVTQRNDEASAHALLGSLRQLYAAIGEQLFYDGKFADIPNTVAGAAAGLRPLAPKFFNIHASAGEAAIKAAAANKGSSLLLGVTVLTSIDDDECQSIFSDTPDMIVFRFTEQLIAAGADGIICSPKELQHLKGSPYRVPLQGYDRLLKVTPGVRPTWAAVGDQKRVMTPGEAVRNGATHLVIGRPITKPPADIGSPAEAAKRIAEEIAEALA